MLSKGNDNMETVMVLSRDRFRFLLRRERVLSDREGSELSLVLFHSTNGGFPPKNYEEILQTFRPRIRSADEVGWFDDKCIGVLLPFTSRTGAERFARDIDKHMKTHGKSYAYSVYTKLNGEHKANPLTMVGGDKPDGILEEKVRSTFTKRMPRWKRSMDIVGSIAGFVLFSPVFLLLTLYIKIVSPGPVFFKQDRVGFKGRLFSFYKFRTMKPSNDVSSHRNYLKNLIHTTAPMEKLDNTSDDRIIPGGKVIRKLALDELPQFVNILKGDMSLVGPRPCIPYEAKEYLRWHTHRFDIFPGLTGLWQVSGKNKLTFQQMIRLDIKYSGNINFWLDVKILLKTFPTLFGIAWEALVNKIKEKFSRHSSFNRRNNAG